ncbi:MAG: methyltransferase, partial [Paludibacteraceae bacterium]|nr:methyltransferase [Paludibacteraceae bacterium]
YNDASNERIFKHKIYGSDISAQALKITEENCNSAGLSKYISLQKANFMELPTPTQKTLIVTNPPYGERIGGNSINKLYAEIGETLKHRFPGAEAWIISSNMEGFYKIGLRPSQKYLLLNGSIECEYRKYELFDGKMKDKKAAINQE